MLRRLLAVLFLALTAAPAHAAPEALKVSGSATFDGEAHPPVGTIRLHGDSAQVGGEITVDGDTATGTLWLDMAGWKTGMDTRDEHLRETFDTAKHPKAKLTLKPWKLAAQPTAIEGVLTLKDHSAPVRGTCSVDAKRQAKCHLDVNLDEYPTVGKISRLGVTVDPKVSVDVTLKPSP